MGFTKPTTHDHKNPHPWLRVRVLTGTGAGCPEKPQGSPLQSLPLGHLKLLPRWSKCSLAPFAYIVPLLLPFLFANRYSYRLLLLLNCLRRHSSCLSSAEPSTFFSRVFLFFLLVFSRLDHGSRWCVWIPSPPNSLLPWAWVPSGRCRDVPTGTCPA